MMMMMMLMMLMMIDVRLPKPTYANSLGWVSV